MVSASYHNDHFSLTVSSNSSVHLCLSFPSSLCLHCRFFQAGRVFILVISFVLYFSSVFVREILAFGQSCLRLSCLGTVTAELLLLMLLLLLLFLLAENLICLHKHSSIIWPGTVSPWKQMICQEYNFWYLAFHILLFCSAEFKTKVLPLWIHLVTTGQIFAWLADSFLHFSLSELDLMGRKSLTIQTFFTF